MNIIVQKNKMTDCKTYLIFFKSTASVIEGGELSQMQNFLQVEKWSLEDQRQNQGGGVGEGEVGDVEPGHGGEAAVDRHLHSLDIVTASHYLAPTSMFL